MPRPQPKSSTWFGFGFGLGLADELDRDERRGDGEEHAGKLRLGLAKP